MQTTHPFNMVLIAMQICADNVLLIIDERVLERKLTKWKMIKSNVGSTFEYYETTSFSKKSAIKN